MSNEKLEVKSDMLPEYDFRGKKGVRGKYYQAYRQGHTVQVVESDGMITTQYFTLEDGAVMLEPDVKQYFPDSDSVNRALRVLITAVPVKTRKSSSKQRAASKA